MLTVVHGTLGSIPSPIKEQSKIIKNPGADQTSYLVKVFATKLDLRIHMVEGESQESKVVL